MTHVQIPAARRFYWSVRRELWENRSLYLAPLVVAAMVLAGFAVALFTLPARVRAATALSAAELHGTIQQPYVIAAIVLMVVDLIVAVVYCLDALYGERRDRSILFWKSLPVSDRMTVLAKASIPILVLPLVTFAATAATQLLMLLASGAVLAANGMSASMLWSHLPFLEMSWINLQHLVAFHGVWYAPFYAWLLLVSAWAPRLPFLWAVLPPVAIGIVERVGFNRSSFASLLESHVYGAALGPAGETMDAMTMDMLAPHSLAHILMSPALWLGLLVAGLFLLVAARLRRTRGPL